MTGDRRGCYSGGGAAQLPVIKETAAKCSRRFLCVPASQGMFIDDGVDF